MADGTWTAWLFVAATKYIYILKLTRKVRGHGTNVMRVSRAARSLKNGLSIFMWWNKTQSVVFALRRKD